MADGSDLQGEGVADHAASNLLPEMQPSLPASCYYDPAHHARELALIWQREWLYVCRSSQLPETGCFHTFEIGDQKLLIVRDKGGELNAFHNTCRHRGAILCPEPAGKLRSKAITCPITAGPIR
jgi:Rieske 2Fe-2S family protein